MIYNSAINSNLSSAKKDLDCYVNHITGIACVPTKKGDGLSKDEDGTLNILYAILSGIPMAIVERIDRVDYTVSEMADYVKSFNNEDCGYIMSFSENEDYYDVSVVASRIIQAARSI